MNGIPASRRLHHRRVLAAILTCLLTAGCGGLRTDYSDLNLKEISGTVTLDGDPVEGAVVVFEAADKSFSSGTTDSSGYYSLTFNSEQSGVLNGPKIVRIGSTLGAEDIEAAEAGTDGGEVASTATIERVPACYNSESQLRVTVTESTTMNFDLKLDCSTQGATVE